MNTLFVLLLSLTSVFSAQISQEAIEKYRRDLVNSRLQDFIYDVSQGNPLDSYYLPLKVHIISSQLNYDEAIKEFIPMKGNILLMKSSLEKDSTAGIDLKLKL